MLQNKSLQSRKPKFLSLLILGCSASCGLFAQEESNPYDKIWDKVTLYENEDNSLVSKFWLTGRLKVNIIALKTMSQGLTMMIIIGEDFGLVSKQPYLVTSPYTRKRTLA